MISGNLKIKIIKSCPEIRPTRPGWDSGGTLPFPGGESREAFQERCRAEFARVLRACRKQAGSNAVFVVHERGTIMSIPVRECRAGREAAGTDAARTDIFQAGSAGRGRSLLPLAGEERGRLARPVG